MVEFFLWAGCVVGLILEGIEAACFFPGLGGRFSPTYFKIKIETCICLCSDTRCYDPCLLRYISKNVRCIWYACLASWRKRRQICILCIPAIVTPSLALGCLLCPVTTHLIFLSLLTDLTIPHHIRILLHILYCFLNTPCSVLLFWISFQPPLF